MYKYFHDSNSINQVDTNQLTNFIADTLWQIIKNVDLKNIVLETDGPYLAPVPFRGKRNQPAYITHVAEKIADLKQISIEEVATTTTANAVTLFGL